MLDKSRRGAVQNLCGGFDLKFPSRLAYMRMSSFLTFLTFLILVFVVFLRLKQQQRRSKRASRANPPTAAPTMTPTLIVPLGVAGGGDTMDVLMVFKLLRVDVDVDVEKDVDVVRVAASRTN